MVDLFPDTLKNETMAVAQQVLKSYFGYDQFRPLQEGIVNHVAQGHHAVAILPTGGGKSICFQVPALMLDGMCLVVTPLVALMKDQVEHLLRKRIRAAALFSGLSRYEQELILNNSQEGAYKFLYISPERLQTPSFQSRLRAMPVSMLAVDEAHCISQWGYDFRPAYLAVADIREIFPEIPILALTASATPEVIHDIIERLQLHPVQVFKGGFARKNLHFVVRHEENKIGKLIEILHKVPGSAIVYVQSRRKTRELALFLQKKKISAEFYHAGLTIEERNRKQQAWIDNRVRVMVCTNAFGMGIDKPDVRVVVHIDVPEHLEAYYQEAGRAGRDGKKAYAVLLFNMADQFDLEERRSSSFPPLKDIYRVYDALCYYFQIPIHGGIGEAFSFDLLNFCKHFKLDAMMVNHSLRILSQQGVISVSDSVMVPASLQIITDRETIYKFMIEHPKYEPLIKYLLRSYAGIFHEPKPMVEATLSKSTGDSPEWIKVALKYLHDTGMISYRPLQQNPHIELLIPRMAGKDLPLDRELITKRRELFFEKSKQMLHYCTQITRCRSNVMESYFGEDQLIPCGKCDVCLESEKMKLAPVAYTELMEMIEHSLEKKPKSLAQLLALIPAGKRDIIGKMIRFLIDQGRIQVGDDQLLHWTT